MSKGDCLSHPPARGERSGYNGVMLNGIGPHAPLRVSIAQVPQRLRGGSQSRLVLCDDGKLYVCKMYPNPQGPNVLANEMLGSIVLDGLGFPVPRWRPITIDRRAVRLFSSELSMTDAVGRMLLPACGVHYGSQHVCSDYEYAGDEYHVLDIIPRASAVSNAEQIAGIYLFDLWANHHDSRLLLYRRHRTDRGPFKALIADNGHLFGGPDWSGDPAVSWKCWAYRVQKPGMAAYLEIDKWLTLFQARIPGLLNKAMAAVDPSWYTGDLYSLCERLLKRLECLSALAYLEDMPEEWKGVHEWEPRCYPD
jgi:hypothetical protein